VAGVVVAASSLVAGLWAESHAADVQTSVFLTLGLGQLAVALALRAPRTRGWHWRERGLELAVLLAGACQLAGVAVPALRSLLGTEAPEAGALLASLLLAAVPGAFVAASQWPARRRGARH